MLRAAFLVLPLLLVSPVTASVDLVVSIKPLQLIVETLAGETVTVRTLTPESGSPHHYTMTPSDRLALESADLIIYIGEPLETELHSAIGGLGREHAVLQLLDIPAISKKQLSGNEQVDPHIWLDSDNGLQIAAEIRDRLRSLDPENFRQVEENFQLLERRLNAERPGWQKQIEELPQSPYAVYHDALSYFESEFGLAHSIVLVDDPEIQPGIRSLMTIRRNIERLRPVCLFTDITSKQNIVDTLFADYEVRQQRVDLMGDRLPEDAGYLDLLQSLVDDFSNCLSGGLFDGG